MGEDEIWQPLPDEWLTPSKTRAGAAAFSAKKSAAKETPNGKGKGKETPKRKTGLESDTDDSELSELSDDEQVEEDSRSKDQIDGPASSELSAEPEELSMMVDGDVGQASRKSTPLSDVEERTSEISRAIPSPDAEHPMNGAKEESTLLEAEPEKAPVEVGDDLTSPGPVTGIEIAAEISPPAEDKMDVVEEPLGTTEEHPTSPAVVLAESDAGAALPAAMDNVPAGSEQQATTAEETAEQDVRPQSPPIDGQTPDIVQPLTEPGGTVVAQEIRLETETPAIETPSMTIAEDIPMAAGASVVKEEEEEEEDPDDEVLLAAKKALNPGFLEWECVSDDSSTGRYLLTHSIQSYRFVRLDGIGRIGQSSSLAVVILTKKPSTNISLRILDLPS